jgi:hypothetical protein
MALQKAIDAPEGFNAASAYWRIVETNFNHADKQGRIVIAAYYDQAARDTGKKSIVTRGYTLAPTGTPALDAGGNPLTLQEDGTTYKNANGDVTAMVTPAWPSFDQLIGMPVPGNAVPGATLVFDIAKAALYALLKARPEFSGSTDV